MTLFKVKNLRKLLYLLQLEDYQSKRYFHWLEKNQIEDLIENKNHLRLTLRVFLTAFFSLIIGPFLGFKKAVGRSNGLLNRFFFWLGKILIFLAGLKLKFFPHLIKIVITGSYGKTTFKEMLSWVLAEKYQVAKTPGNINTALGIVSFILKNLQPKTEILIIEAGAYQKGEISEIGCLVQPHFGIITIIGWMHLERFGTLQKIKEAKFELADFIKDKKNLFFPPENHQFLDFPKTILKIAQRLKIPQEKVEQRIKSFRPPVHRLTPQKISQQLILLDDSYNSNPLGFQKALGELKKYRGYQKIVVTPGMIELGFKQEELNREAAQKAAQVADLLVIVGETNRKALLSGANQVKRKNLKIVLMANGEDFKEKISPFLRPPTVVLLENDLPDHFF